MRLAIRADASLAIGSGHVMRCLTLAEAVMARGGEVLFICRAHDGHLAEMIATRGVRVVCLETPLDGRPSRGTYGDWLGVDAETDARQTLAALDERDFEPDWMVVDHYGLGADWETALRRAARRIMVIDDLADRPHDCNLLLDQNWIADFETRYAALVPAGSRLLLGPAYALLQRPYREIAGRAEIRSGGPRRVLVYFGATDAAGLTLQTLDAFLGLDREDVTADIVVGSGNADRSALLDRAAGRANVNVHLSLPSLAELMLAADLAVGAGGTTSWERICLKLPALVVTLADNQRPIAAEIDRIGLARWLGDAADVDKATLASALRDCLGSAGTSWFDGRLASKIDGQGAERVVDALFGGDIVVRRANLSDTERTFDWRNHPSIRAVSHNSEEIEFADHKRWFADVLSSTSRFMLIGERGGEPVGVVRFDVDDGVAVVSIYLAPGHSAKGDGGKLLLAAEAWLAQEVPRVQTVAADIRPGNDASAKMFMRCGYKNRFDRFSKSL